MASLSSCYKVTERDWMLLDDVKGIIHMVSALVVRVRIEVCLDVKLLGRRSAIIRSLAPLCIGRIEMPDRNVLVAANEACANNNGPEWVTPIVAL